MASFRKTLSDIDWPIFAAVLVLVSVGVMFIYSSGVTSEGLVVSQEYLKQTIWAVSGIALMLVLVLVDFSRVRDYTFVIYLFFVVVLIYTRMFGRVVNGAKSWIGFGDFGIQPSEFAKIATILYLASFLAATAREAGSLGRFLKAWLIVAVPMGLILAQPDFGTALVFIPIFLVMTYFANVKRSYIGFFLAFVGLTSVLIVLPLYEKVIAKKQTAFFFIFYEMPYVFIVLAAVLCVFAFAVLGFRIFRKRYYFRIACIVALIAGSLIASLGAQFALKEYQIMRLIVFLDPRVDALGSGWNILQSVTAIGSGGLFGKGFLQGTQSHYRYLPQQSTDFIFSIIAEEWGFVGGLVVFFCVFLILWRCLSLIRNVKDANAAYIVAGIIGMLAFHFMINVGMTMGIMPITGIPLYFLSYGGSSLWAIMMSMGVVLSVSARKFRA